MLACPSDATDPRNFKGPVDFFRLPAQPSDLTGLLDLDLGWAWIPCVKPALGIDHGLDGRMAFKARSIFGLAQHERNASTGLEHAQALFVKALLLEKIGRQRGVPSYRIFDLQQIFDSRARLVPELKQIPVKRAKD